MNFLLRFLLTSALGFLLFWYMPAGLFRDQPGTLLAAVAIGILDSFVKPSRITKRFPITVYTLLILMTGLNALLIKLCERYIPGFEISGWGPAVAVGFAMAALSLLIDRFVKAD